MLAAWLRRSERGRTESAKSSRRPRQQRPHRHQSTIIKCMDFNSITTARPVLRLLPILRAVPPVTSNGKEKEDTLLLQSRVDLKL